MVHADHRRHHRQVLTDARGLILLTGATGYIGSRLLREIEAGGCTPGDRMLLFTDGVLETTSPDDTPFDTHGIETLLNRESGSRGDARLATRRSVVPQRHERIDARRAIARRALSRS